jgi:hypothetical protein
MIKDKHEKKNQFEKTSKKDLCQLDLTNLWLGMRDQDNPTLKKKHEA